MKNRERIKKELIKFLVKKGSLNEYDIDIFNFQLESTFFSVLSNYDFKDDEIELLFLFSDGFLEGMKFFEKCQKNEIF